ncbi:hypothetical protein EVG20_g5230 [Dentipellis fragilis]|uniref:UDP-N-acetylglucosamine transferase subunit ALG14 n=1 Tax=Dentipellis fragilis TaxID=205917 RepID=A0A4Y9YVT7_9AGAM|nr:hypothetical protein EVG20_g5230 [Dentipellis fragilis]
MFTEALVAAAFALVLVRIYFVSHPQKTLRPRTSATCSLAVFLGSGGHTSEALSLVSALDFTRYTPRTYIVSSGDSLSVQKALALEVLKVSTASSSVCEIFRCFRGAYLILPYLRQEVPKASTTGSLQSPEPATSIRSFARHRGRRFAHSSYLSITSPWSLSYQFLRRAQPFQKRFY